MSGMTPPAPWQAAHRLTYFSGATAGLGVYTLLTLILAGVDEAIRPALHTGVVYLFTKLLGWHTRRDLAARTHWCELCMTLIQASSRDVLDSSVRAHQQTALHRHRAAEAS